MIEEAAIISRRLVMLSEDVRAIGAQSGSVNQRQFPLSVAELIEREHDRLERAIAACDGVAIAWALRSIADMMKGLIDIGSDLPDAAPNLWKEAKDLAQQAHHIERHARRP